MNLKHSSDDKQPIGWLFDTPEHKATLYASALALLKSNSKGNHKEDYQPPVIKLEGKVISLDNCVGVGGSKTVYDLGDGNVIITQNTDVDKINPTMWERIALEEVTMARKVNASGLRAQCYEQAVITVNEFPLITIKAPSFSGMIAKGMQVRDAKRDRTLLEWVKDDNSKCGFRKVETDNDPASGTSDIFGTKENLMNPEYWRQIFASLLEDLTLYFANGFYFFEDSFNLLIEDTENTPNYGFDTRASIGERHQRLRLFFYDFTSKEYSLETKNSVGYPFVDKNGNVIEENLRDYTDKLLNRVIYVTLEGSSNAEFRNITGKEDPSYVWNTLIAIAKEVLSILKPEFSEQIIATTKKKIEDMPLATRIDKFYEIGSRIFSY